MASTIQLYNATAEDKYNLTADPISMMKKAGLDWKVSTLPIVAVGNDGAAYNGGDYRAIVREDTFCITMTQCSTLELFTGS